MYFLSVECISQSPVLVRAGSMWLSLCVWSDEPGVGAGACDTQPAASSRARHGLAQTCYFLTHGPGPRVTLRDSDTPNPRARVPLTAQNVYGSANPGLIGKQKSCNVNKQTL